MEPPSPVPLFPTIPADLWPPHWQAIAPTHPFPAAPLITADVHLWTVDLAQSPDLITHLATVLNPTEQQRANQFYFPQDAHRFIVARGMLRQILSIYLGIAPHDVQFGYGDRGKPHIITTNPATDLQFNLAHSHDLAVYAIACDRQIGVDLERVRAIPKATQLAQRFFSAREFQSLQNLPVDVQSTTFLRYWTCKEAYVKACGVGLALPTREIEIGLDAGEAALLSVSGDRSAPQQWSLHTLALGHCPSSCHPSARRWESPLTSLSESPDCPSYLAALVVEGQDWQLTCLPCL